jgi:hypothetical protein
MEFGVTYYCLSSDRGNMAHWGGLVQSIHTRAQALLILASSNIFPLAHTHWLSGLVGGWPQMRFGSTRSGCELSRLRSDNIRFYILVSYLLRLAWVSSCIYHTCLLIVFAVTEGGGRVLR